MTEILSTYDINERTMALIPAAHIDYQTIVYEQGRKLFVHASPIQLLKKACLEGGADYEGRRKAVMFHTGAQRKVPIPIDPMKNIYAFPTHSPSQFQCSWIFYNHIKHIKPNYTSSRPTTQAMITFKNDLKIPLNESMYLLEKQMQRTATCMLKFSQPFENYYLYQG